MMGTVAVRPRDFGKRTGVRTIDEDIDKKCTPDVVIREILRGRYLDPALATKLEKGRRLGTHNLRVIAKALAKAIYNIPTCRGWFMNGQVETESNGRHTIRLGATLLPWADGDKNSGPMYLCINVHDSRKESLVARLAVAALTVDGVTQSVLVTDHVCDKIEERAGVRGSHVAFIADSVVFNKLRIAKQPNSVRLLTIYDSSQNVIGYCPISKKKCGLQRTQDAMSLKDGRQFVSVQDRWRLKTFEPADYFVEADDGCLVPNRAVQMENKSRDALEESRA